MLRRLRHFLALFLPAILVLVLAFVLLCHLNRWDEFVVITLIPLWAWAAVGVLVSILSWALMKNRLALLTFALWLMAGIGLSDETAGLLREFHAAVTGSKPTLSITADAPTDERFRIITLNCNDAKSAAVGDLKKLRPDLVLLQEAPDRATLIDLTSDLFALEGTFIRSEQCAILARGRLSESVTDPATGSLYAVLEHPSGKTISVVNVHLPRATPRFDIWNPDCWRELTEQRKVNRRTLRDLLELLPKPGSSPEKFRRIVGGSFGAPPSDDIYRLLRNLELVDSFRRAGYGWGNTFPSSMPLLRVDGIWASAQFAPLRSETLTIEASDHRYVVSDFRPTEPVGKLAFLGKIP